MAKAGFVHCPSENEPDVVCCFFSLKELEGWEPTDDPWSEHAKRSTNCGFLTLEKDVGDCTVKEHFKLEQKRLCICISQLSINPLPVPHLSLLLRKRSPSTMQVRVREKEQAALTMDQRRPQKQKQLSPHYP